MMQETQKAQETDNPYDGSKDEINESLLDLQCLVVPGNTIAKLIKLKGRGHDSND